MHVRIHFLFVVPLLVLAGCRDEAPEADRLVAPPPSAPVAAPGSGGRGAMPAPMGAGSAAGVPAPPPGSGTGAASLTWDAPAGWTSEPPSSAMRKAQYRVPGEAGDAELVVFYFGPQQGGDPKANAMRWAGQFTQPDGRASSELLKTRAYEVGDIDVMEVEVTGTYVGGPMMGGPAPAPRPDQMLLGAVAEGPDANWFFKMTGPRQTVEGQRAAFEGMMKSLRRGG